MGSPAWNPEWLDVPTLSKIAVVLAIPIVRLRRVSVWNMPLAMLCWDFGRDDMTYI
jgi:hypothetical protein